MHNSGLTWVNDSYVTDKSAFMITTVGQLSRDMDGMSLIIKVNIAAVGFSTSQYENCILKILNYLETLIMDLMIPAK